MRKNRLISLILAITLVLTMFSGITVFAEDVPCVSASIYGASDISGKTAFGGSLRTVANVQTETTVKFIVVVYDDIVLQKAESFDVTLTPEDTVLDVPYTVTGLTGAANQKAKAFLWTGLDKLVPISEAMPVEGEIYVRVEGIPASYNTLTAVIEGYTPKADDVITYLWEYKTPYAGYKEASDINPAEGSIYERTFTQRGNVSTIKRFRVRVTINGTEYVSTDVNSVAFPILNQNIHRILQNDAKNNENIILSYANKTTPKEYVFKAEGMEFILLDSISTSDTGRFFIMTKDSVGSRTYTERNDADQRSFNQYPYNMTAWLNNKAKVDFYGGRTDKTAGTVAGAIKLEWSGADYSTTGYIGNANYTQIPERILSLVDNDTYWWVERGRWWHDSNSPDHFVGVQGGLQLLSIRELVNYGDKIGLADCENWWLRTPAMNVTDTAGGNAVQVVDTAVLGTTSFKNEATATAEIRPVFYAHKDLFLEVPIDLSTAGAAVITTLAENYSREELKAAGYSETDLKAYFDPIISYVGSVASAEIKSEGTFEVNNTLKLVYDGTNLEEAKIQWYTSLTDAGCFVEAVGETKRTFIPKDSEAGKYIKAKITLKNGKTKESNVIKLADALSAAASYDGTTAQIGTNVEDQEEYIFTVGDKAADGTVKNSKEFVLLDTTENDESHFLVMSNAYTGTRYYSAGTIRGNAANDYTYISTPLDSAAYLNHLDEVTMYINSEQLMMPDYEYTVTNTDGTYTYTYTKKTDAEGNALTRPAYGAYNYGSDGQPLSLVLMDSAAKPASGVARSILPEAVWNSINYNQVWNCEPIKVSGKEVRYAVKAGVMLPSVAEIAKYAHKFNLYPGGRQTGGSVQDKLNSCWWTRTSAGGTAIKCVNFANVGQIADRNYHTEWNAGLSIRPIFYLNRDFFIDNVIDLATAGSDVCSKIRATYSNEELLTAGYLQADIDTYLGEEAAE